MEAVVEAGLAVVVTAATVVMTMAVATLVTRGGAARTLGAEATSVFQRRRNRRMERRLD